MQESETDNIVRAVMVTPTQFDVDKIDEVPLSGLSPASTGPAGARFEAQIGAHYLLTMLVDSEPRGLPGTCIESVALQAAGDGFPLDDVVIHAREISSGRAATLQIQVKRTVSFAPNDAVFKKVVRQIAEAIASPRFWDGRHELAVAISRASRMIEGSYQDVLKWARHFDTARTFFDRLSRPGVANDGMRTFVETLRDNLRIADAPGNDEAVWKVLRRLQILIFDYAAVGSSAEELARERAVRILSPGDSAQASALWGVLTDVALDVASVGGEYSRPRLLDELATRSIRIGETHSTFHVRSAIAEASEQALADIDDRVGTVSLTRARRIHAVNDALEKGRFVEIRGDAGVGKSGIIKHFATILSAESRILVLSPGRTPSGGWTAFRATIGFTGTARELLADLAADGGIMLFIDNVNSFDDAERLTVNDLLRAAASVRGTSVMVTGRRQFAGDEPSWLDGDAIKTLTPAPPIVVGELDVSELDELGSAEPRLKAILSDDHPARDVVRNLYRLSRLAFRLGAGLTPTSELDMAEQWWSSADGRQVSGRRLRARLLRTLAIKALEGHYLLDVKNDDPPSIDALVSSGTLRDLGNDVVVFKHDVLRQWAIGNLLAADQSLFAKLPLSEPPSDDLARAMELAARFALEREPNGAKWSSILYRVSEPGALGSWRRAVLLALVHSEQAGELLQREADTLLADDGRLLRELIRTVMAVDVEPATRVLDRMGMSGVHLSAELFLPRGASWQHLIAWLLKLGAHLPFQALGDVADLYGAWMLGTFGLDPIAPRLLAWLHAWLTELENPAPPGSEARTYKVTHLYGEEYDLVDKLRTVFLLFSNRAPELATTYLNQVRKYHRGSRAVSNIMKFRGTLSQAAPRELAALTAEALIAKREEQETYRRRDWEDPFEFLDSEFHPAAPGQGPFLELLKFAPQEGLALIRTLVDHAIQFSVRGKDPGDDGYLIPLDDGERFFPWSGTYRWSRGEAGHEAMVSGLLALEAWCHERIEAGEEFGKVLKDALGPPGTSAAFLLIAVDLILSHWPKSRSKAFQFLGCVELLTRDRVRPTEDKIEYPDFFGINALEREPAGTVTRADLKKRLSRNVSLERLLDHYACFGPEEVRMKLKILLEGASKRLGAYEVDSDFSDPRFMAYHALNRLNPENWHWIEAQLEDGRSKNVQQYVSPAVEAEHLAKLQAAAATRMSSAAISTFLLQAIDDPSRSSTQIAADAAAWAQEELARPRDEEDDKNDIVIRSEAIRAAAFIAVRDGTEELLRSHASWAEGVFRRSLEEEDKRVYSGRGGLKFNPIATAFAGFVELYRRRPSPTYLRVMLEIAARKSPAGAHGFSRTVGVLAKLDERIPKAIIRCAFTAALKPLVKRGAAAQDASRCGIVDKRRREKAIEDELAWIAGTGPEPTWPPFDAEASLHRRRRQRGFQLKIPAHGDLQKGTISVADISIDPQPPGSPISTEDKLPPEFSECSPAVKTFVDDQAAALWLDQLSPILGVAKCTWLLDLAKTYARFSSELNGSGLSPYEELSRSPYEWNSSYYQFLAGTLIGSSAREIDEVMVGTILCLPDQSFCNVAPVFLREVDVQYFNRGLYRNEAPMIRERFVGRLLACSGWRNLVGRRSASVEIHLGPCIGAIVFNDYTFGSRNCYLTEKAIDNIAPFLPQLIRLVTEGPSYFIAFVTMDLLEVSPRPDLLPLLISGAMAWLDSYADDKSLWIEHGIGKRVCAWLDRVLSGFPEGSTTSLAERKKIDEILVALVRLGLPEARQLETALAATQK